MENMKYVRKGRKGDNELILRLVSILAQGQTEYLIPLLRQLNTTEKKKVAVLLRDIDRLKWEDYSFTPDEGVEDCLAYSRFVCFSKSDIEYIKKDEESWRLFPSPEKLLSILEWYRPNWFTDYYNELFEQNRIYIPYLYLIQWKRAGLITSTPPARIADIFPYLFWINGDINQPERFLIELVTFYPEILEDICTVFAYPCDVAQQDKSSVLHVGMPYGPITTILRQYSRYGTPNRMWILKESLAAHNRGFKKIQSGWYADLFMAMEPSCEELLELQNELLSSLHSPCSKGVHTALKCIKRICPEKTFRSNDFIPLVPMLLSSSHKSIQVATLAVMKLLAQSHPCQSVDKESA
ncbi:hypothetical protein D0T51_02675 [Parabacteroides sp. 52]|uniref:DUF6493 family protein n=1 Tax=unclassified Parabacteroides TaxID=2649774 RepID=UPI0013D46B17|nr:MULTISPECIES: DUF6493 family protein [unclassified Parabacteroides]MDH6533893.1 hypothetical protein [Parabacteroides sp. PM5-20]NDV54638.1 hypothetical protein [Parabacteroides sp. 52]